MKWLPHLLLLTLATMQSSLADESNEGNLSRHESELSSLPQPISGPSGGTLGYSSATQREPVPEIPKWVAVDLGEARKIDAVALVPAWMTTSNREELSHGFPLRFRVEASLSPTFEDAVVLFEAQDVEFPDPGRHPVWIEFAPRDARFVRVVATELSAIFFGLAEVAVFSGDLNLAQNAKVIALDRLNFTGNWRPINLTDGFTPLGIPIEGAEKYRGGFRSAPLDSEFQETSLKIDFGGIHEVDTFSLCPALGLQNLSNLSKYGEGFPAAMTIDLRDRQGKWITVFEHEAEETYRFPNPGNVAWSHRLAQNVVASAIRITATRHRFIRDDESFRFALAEVIVLDRNGKNIASGASVSASHPDSGPGSAAWQPSRVVDGWAGEGKLMPLRNWYSSLDRRRILLGEISSLRESIRDVKMKRSLWKKRILWAFGGCAVVALLFGFWRVREGRKRQASALREQIANDLHDEIGSTLGSIALFSETLSKRELLNEKERGRLSDVAVMAREASQTMRDLVWVVDQRTDNTEQLVRRLRATAAKILGDLPFQSNADTTSRTQAISPDQKRHLLLFVKEALHNVIRHAKASNVSITVANRRSWHIKINDDGSGFHFDPDNARQLEKLRARSRKLNGKLDIKTAPGDGTTLTLVVPA